MKIKLPKNNVEFYAALAHSLNTGVDKDWSKWEGMYAKITSASEGVCWYTVENGVVWFIEEFPMLAYKYEG